VTVSESLAYFISPSTFFYPDRIKTSPWIEHIPFAFWLIPALNPRTLVELGAREGDSYCAFCQVIQACEIDARAFAVDNWKGKEQSGLYEKNSFQELARYHDEKYSAFSRLIRSTFDEAVARFDDGSIDLLHINGHDTDKCVAHDLRTWLPKLSSRAVVLFHDTNARDGGFGVFEAWAELTLAYPGFAFHHGSGLGVLGVGRDLPEPIVRLMDARTDEPLAAAIRGAYSELGRSISARVSLDRKNAECARLSAENADLKAAAARSGRALQGVIDGLSDSIIQDVALLRTWDASASWKVAGIVSRLSRLGKESTSCVWRPQVLADEIAEMLRHAQEAKNLNEMDEETAAREFVGIHATVKEKLRSLERSASLEISGTLRALASLRNRLNRPMAGAKQPLGRPRGIDGVQIGRSPSEHSAPGANSGKSKEMAAKFAIYYSRAGNYFMREISILLHVGLQRLGFSSELRTEADGESGRADIHVVVAPHEFFFRDVGARMFNDGRWDNLVMVNTEQPGNHWFRLAESTFARAQHVFDPNHGGSEFIKKLGYSASHLPPAFVEEFSLYNAVSPLPKTRDTESLGDDVCQWLDTDRPLSERPIDVSFVGMANRRRCSFFAGAAARIEKFECHLRLSAKTGPLISDPRDRDLGTKITTGLSRRSKIVLNIHQDDSPYFEWHRVIFMGLWQRALVISETVTESQPFIPGVDFVAAPLEEIPEAIEYYLRDPVGIQQAENIRSAGFMKLKTQCSLQSILENAWRPLIDRLAFSGSVQSPA